MFDFNNPFSFAIADNTTMKYPPEYYAYANNLMDSIGQKRLSIEVINQLYDLVHTYPIDFLIETIEICATQDKKGKQLLALICQSP